VPIEHCPICGFGPFSETYASAQELRFSFDICPCCGCEYGYDDIESHYLNWAASGFQWFNPKLKPEDWCIEAQLKYQIRPWPPRSGET
jgi:hypothetical protein